MWLANLENNKSIEKINIINLIKSKLNLDEVTRLKLQNKVEYIYVGKDENINIEFKNY